MILTIVMAVLVVATLLTGLGALNMLSLGGHMLAQGLAMALAFLFFIFLLMAIAAYTGDNLDEDEEA